MSRVPRIRFKGFEEDWEQRKLGEIADKVVEKNFQLQETDVFTNSAEFGIIDQKDFFDHEIVNKNNIGGYYIVSPNDFVYNPRISVTAPVGPINRNKLCKRGIMSPLYTVFHPRNMNETFLEFYFKTNKWHKFMEYNGDSGARSDRFSIKTELFYAMTIPFPSREEQSKVGICFESIDHLITLHQRKLEKLKIIKKSMLENLFPKNGVKTPKIRFSGFTKDWEQRKLGEIGNTYSGLSGKTKDDFGHGQASFITYMNVYSNPVSRCDMVEPIEIDNRQNEVEIGDVFFTTSSETPEEVGMTSVLTEKRGIIYLNSFCFGFRPFEKIDKYYLAYMLRSKNTREKIILLAQGISRYNISKNKVMEIPVELPSFDEQILIGKKFQLINHLITLHQSKLEKLQKIKKSMLESMFV